MNETIGSVAGESRLSRRGVLKAGAVLGAGVWQAPAFFSAHLSPAASSPPSSRYHCYVKLSCDSTNQYQFDCGAQNESDQNGQASLNCQVNLFDRSGNLQGQHNYELGTCTLSPGQQIQCNSPQPGTFDNAQQGWNLVAQFTCDVLPDSGLPYSVNSFSNPVACS